MTFERLGLYASTHIKNGSVVKVCLMKENLVNPAAPVLAENHSPNDKRVWEYCIGELMKTERVLEGNLCILFAILMSLCDSDIKNSIESSMEYAPVEEELDSIKLLATIKKLVHTRRTQNLNISHNKSIAHTNLMNLYHDKFQDIQDFRDQFMAMRKMFDELGIRIGRCADEFQG